jgi:hypothetical protein
MKGMNLIKKFVSKVDIYLYFICAIGTAMIKKSHRMIKFRIPCIGACEEVIYDTCSTFKGACIGYFYLGERV